jgi:broad specificity phosphatase PhoE
MEAICKPESENTTIYLARHGEIKANVDQRWHGSTDSELTDAGKEQAELLASYLHGGEIAFDAIYTSPLKRARQTAEPTARLLGIEPLPLDGLAEFDIGVLENRSYEDLLNKDGFYRRIEEDINFAPPRGESVIQVGARMIDAIRKVGREHAGETVLMVSHGAAIAIALSYLLDGAYYPFHQYHSSNTGLTHLSIPGDAIESDTMGEAIELRSFNRTDHL